MVRVGLTTENSREDNPASKKVSLCTRGRKAVVSPARGKNRKHPKGSLRFFVCKPAFKVLVLLIFPKKKTMFVRKQGLTKVMYLSVTTSTAISKGALVAWSSGLLIAATSTTAPSTIAGVCLKTIASTDADYAVARKIPVEVPVELGVLWTADVTATAVAADQGLYCDLTDSLTVNRGGSTYDVVQIVNFLTTTKCEVILNIGTFGCGVIGA